MPRERDRVLRDAAIIVVPSRWAEPFALVGLEAGIFGTPAVAFDTGGISGWLTVGGNGRLISPARGANGLGDLMTGILGNPGLHRRLGTRARAGPLRVNLDFHRRALPLAQQLLIVPE